MRCPRQFAASNPGPGDGIPLGFWQPEWHWEVDFSGPCLRCGSFQGCSGGVNRVPENVNRLALAGLTLAPVLTPVFKLVIAALRADILPMQTLTLLEAQQHLAELVREFGSEGEWIITDASGPVAKLSPVNVSASLRDLRPKSVGAVLRPFPAPEDDTLGEMLDSRP